MSSQIGIDHSDAFGESITWGTAVAYAGTTGWNDRLTINKGIVDKFKPYGWVRVYRTHQSSRSHTDLTPRRVWVQAHKVVKLVQPVQKFYFTEAL